MAQNKMKLLVVDDSDVDRRIVVKYLRGGVVNGVDFEVLEASSVGEAIALVKSCAPDLVLLDYHLADGTAETFLGCLQSVNLHSHIEVVVITGQDDSVKSQSVLNNGAIDYLTKEMVTATTLPVIVRNLFEKIALKREVEEQREELEAFAYRISHDLRGALSNIAGAADLIKHADDLEEVEEVVQILGIGVDQASRIIQGLYELSQVNKIKAEGFSVVSVKEMVEDALLSNQSKFKHAKYTLECDDFIKCSKYVFPQIFQNLIDNSFKFSERDDLEIHIESHDESGSVRIRYEDNGPGIPSAIREHMFEAFQAQHKKGQDGLGLGMNIVKKILDLHGGSIAIAEPEKLSGAAFEFSVLSPSMQLAK